VELTVDRVLVLLTNGVHHSTVPLFILLTVLLMYSIAWLSYLMLAQDDPPASSVSSILSPALDGTPAAPTMTKNYLPFLPFSPLRCVKVNWAALQYAATVLRVAVPTVFDWCYRRLMVVGAPNRGGLLVKENILYGSPFPNKRLDVYIPPERPTLAPGDTQKDHRHGQSPSGEEAGTASGEHVRTRKHSTMQFNEPPPARVPASTPVKERAKYGAAAGASGQANASTSGAAVIVVLPPVIPPFSWVSKRKTYMQLALLLRRLGYCVVVPDITYFPESRIKESVIDVRIVLRWVGEHIAHYGGDPRRIHLLGHGLSAHLAMLVVVQEGVVLSREAHLDRAWNREQHDTAKGKRQYETWDERAEEEEEEDARDEGDKVKGTFETWRRRNSVGNEADGQGEKLSANALARLEAELAKQNKGAGGGSDNLFSSFSAAQARLSAARGENVLLETEENENDWVDEDSMMPGPPPGLVSLGKELPADSIAFPTSGSSDRLHDAGAPSGARQTFRTSNATGHTTAHAHASSQALHHARYEPNTLAEAEAQVTGGLKKVEIYEPQIAVPPLAGVILLAGVADVIKGWRSEMEKGVEHLSFLRRAMGVSHTACLVSRMLVVDGGEEERGRLIESCYCLADPFARAPALCSKEHHRHEHAPTQVSLVSNASAFFPALMISAHTLNTSQDPRRPRRRSSNRAINTDENAASRSRRRARQAALLPRDGARRGARFVVPWHGTQLDEVY
jgi:acetyl esterase/lipase